MRSRCSQSALSGIAGEAAHRVVREAGGDRRVGAVAQQPQRDVHADLRAPAGEQRAPAGEVGAGVAPRVVAAPRRPGRAGGRTRRPRVAALADVAGARRAAACRRVAPVGASTRAAGPAVSSSMRPGAPVAVAAVTASSSASDRVAPLLAPALLDASCRGRPWPAARRRRRGARRAGPSSLGEHPQAGLEVRRVDAPRRPVRMVSVCRVLACPLLRSVPEPRRTLRRGHVGTAAAPAEAWRTGRHGRSGGYSGEMSAAVDSSLMECRE